MNSIFIPGETFTQENRHIRIETSLGEDVLLLTEVQGNERLSSLFQFRVHMLSHRGDITPEEIVGDHVAVTISPYDEDCRFFNGFVSSFESIGPQGRGLFAYVAEFVPWLWFLTNRTNYRVFQQQSIPEIVETIFADFGYADYKLSLNEEYPKLEYCVQFGESDFDFISRLLEKEGIFYYFTHESSIHTLILADSVSAFAFHDKKEFELDGGTRAIECIKSWQHRYRYLPSRCLQNDFNYETANNSLMTETSSYLNLLNSKNFSIYEYPGEYQKKDRGTRLTKVRMEEIETGFDIIQAMSDIGALSLAKKFKLIAEHNADHNKSFAITDISHHACESSYRKADAEEGFYKNRFTCIPEKAPFRPARTTPKPKVEGVQTATVVGRSGDEIYTDEYGRIKIQFHWDNYGNKDENSSCWVRVATAWAGNKWGSVAIPRVGQEVVITFVNGDPDQPLVIGSVYNSLHMPPYPLPDKKNISGVKSRSTKGGDSSTYNEISFDDTKGQEAITIHAQKDFNIKTGKNVGASAGGNSSCSVEGDSSSSVGGNNTTSITGNDTYNLTGNYTGSIDGSSTKSVKGNCDESIKGDASVSIDGKRDDTIKGDHNLNINSSQNVSVKSDQGVKVNGGQTFNVSGDQTFNAANQIFKIKSNATTDATEIALTGKSKITLSVAGSSVTIDATGITLSMGASSVKVDAMGVTVAGPMVKLN